MRLYILLKSLFVVCIAIVFTSCGNNSNTGASNSEPISNLSAINPEKITEGFGISTETMDIKDNNLVHRIKINPIGGSLRNVFNDSNAIHLIAAQAIGISPITDLHTAYNLTRPIQEIYTCKAYHIDNLTHSMPYLVPQAARLLYEIGTEFSDSVLARGGAHYRIKVTSLMRTDVTVAKLRRRNRNATVDSAHRYGTTFDISYARFMCLDTANIISLEDLKNLLAEILNKKREEGRCYVKFERKQGCFHITTRQ